MVYEFKNGVLNIYQNGVLNITQPYNPITHEPFKTEEEAADWLVHYLATTHEAAPVKANMSAVGLGDDEEAFEFDGSKVTTLIDEAFKLTFSLPEVCTDTKINMIVSRVDTNSRSYDPLYREFSLNIKNGKCSKTLVLEHAGVYHVWLDGWLECASGKKILLQKQDDYVLEIN